MKFPFELLNDAEIDVVGFGTNAVDYLIRVPEFPKFGSKLELDGWTESPGGEVASTLVGLTRLGFRTEYCGRFGGDAAGEIGLGSLQSEGVSVTRAEIVETALTQVAFILIDATSGERTVIWKRDGRLAYTAAEAPVDIVKSAKILHMTPHDTDACIELARIARQTGTIITLDVDNIFPGLEELLTLVDVCITAAGFPEKLTGIDDSRAALAEMTLRYNCPVLGTTRGTEGSVLIAQGEFIETDSFPVPGGCVDTTGAGDAFRAGLLCGILDGETIEESARMANATAALKCRRLGARAGLPGRDELGRLTGKA